MTTEARRRYCVLVPFGWESAGAITEPARFRELTDAVAGLLSLACPELKARGRVVAERGRKVTPRRGRWSAELRDKYVESIARGTFCNIELFDAMWSKGREPDAYGSVNALPYSGDWGVDSTVTVAVREDFVEDALGRLKSAAKSLLPRVNGFYGTIETGVPWDQPMSGGEYFVDMIDIRWHTRVGSGHRRYGCRMQDAVRRVDRGNIFCRSQLTDADPRGMLKVPGIAAVETWPGGFTYVQLAEQPEYGALPPPQLARFIRFIPDE